jgi:hypothetical protein
MYVNLNNIGCVVDSTLASSVEDLGLEQSRSCLAEYCKIAFGLTVTALILYGLGGLVLLIQINKSNLQEVGDEFHYILNCPCFIYN